VLEVGGWRLEVGGWRLEVRGWRLWECLMRSCKEADCQRVCNIYVLSYKHDRLGGRSKS